MKQTPITLHSVATCALQIRRRMPAAGLCLLAAAQANAQTSTTDSVALEEVTVTATRRATSAQEVPIAITAIGAADLQQLGISEASQLTRVVPNLFVTTGYSPGNVRIAIRGLGSTSFGSASSSPVGVYIDDVYQPYSFGVGSQLFDLSRVEVLRGPQGTLFGKNTTAGAVNYFSAAPTEQTEGYVRLDVVGGDYNRHTAEGMFNAPLSDSIDARADFRFDERDDYVHNSFSGDEIGNNTNYAGRVQFEYAPSDLTRINLKLYGMDSRGDGTLYHGTRHPGLCSDGFYQFYTDCSTGVPQPATSSDDRITQSEIGGGLEDYYNYSATLRINHKLGDLELTSITNYQRIDYHLATNDDGVSDDYFHTEQPFNAKQYSEELRLATSTDARLSGIFGVFAMEDDNSTYTYTGSTLLGPGADYALISSSNTKTRTLAGFANATFRFVDAFDMTGGLRYSSERKSIDGIGGQFFSFAHDLTDAQLRNFDFLNPPFALLPGDSYNLFAGERTFDKLTWDVTANYRPNDDVMLYARAAEGFRSGAFNSFVPSPASFVVVEPEELRAYEIGMKSEWLGRRLRLNASAYHWKYSNQQVSATNGSEPGLSLRNAASSTIQGFEVELEALLTDALRLQATVGHTDATFDTFNSEYAGAPVSLAGKSLPYAPEWSATALLGYDIRFADGLLLALTNDWSYRSRVYFDQFNLLNVSDPSLLTGNLRASLRHEGSSARGWSVSVYVNNLTDESYKIFAFDQVVWDSAVFGDRRTYGFQLGYQF